MSNKRHFLIATCDVYCCLLQPVCQLVFGKEVVNDKANPAGDEQYYDGQQFLYSVNGEFPDFKTCLDGEDKSYNPNDKCNHNLNF